VTIRKQDSTGHTELEFADPQEALEKAQELEKQGFYLVALNAEGVPVSEFVRGGKLATDVVTLDAIADQTGG